MKRSTIYFLLSSIVLCYNFYGQSDPDKDYKEKLTTALSSFSTSNSITSLGNFASLSTASNTLSASLFFLDKNNTAMYTVNASAGTSEGITTLFDEGKLNSKVVLGVEYRVLNKNAVQVVPRESSQERNLKLEIQKAEDDYQKKLLALVELSQNGQSDFSNDAALVARKSKIDAQITKLYGGSIDLNKEKNFTIHQKNLKGQLFKLRDEVERQMAQKNDASYFGVQESRLAQERKDKISAIKKKIAGLKPNNIHLEFWSLGYSAKREDFKLLVDSLSFDNQLASNDYISHTLTGSYNIASNLRNVEKNDFSKVTQANKRFFSIGASFSYSNNLSSLKQVEVVDSKVIDSTNNRVRNIKTNAFEGDYKEDINSVRLFIDYYTFLNRTGGSIALHFNPETLIRDFQKPVSSFQFGVLIPFKNKDKQSTKVNVEFFYRIKDIFNTTDSANSLLNRNQIGFQTTFPFNF